MEDMLIRVVENMTDRVSGPLHFRLVLQPVMAIIFAVLSGINDAKNGKSPYFWSLFTRPEHRREMLKDGWKSIGKVFVLAMILDVAYQFIELGFVYPGEVAIVAFVLAIVPYLIVRGIVTRIIQAVQK
ncbi:MULTISPECIES: hypothetical protein [unclassified Marinobacter]|uniref:hypothetical protein n=1 Tax=unclassified Marinobacter TaxID=83889 RepID=UPI0026E40B28|nr:MULTISPECIES: hypothetical protein [unclassified Marinobacter]MDO6443615.1 hypothetical protein [Marinobacter sp. 2_MG-2023]MDO6825468.1 hypothetical protein [Marinobacter sp. 1_MG-2023]